MVGVLGNQNVLHIIFILHIGDNEVSTLRTFSDEVATNARTHREEPRAGSRCSNRTVILVHYIYLIKEL